MAANSVDRWVLTVFLSFTCRSPVPGPFYWLFLCLWHLIPSHVNLRGSDNYQIPRWDCHPQWDIPIPHHSHHHNGTTAVPP